MSEELGEIDYLGLSSPLGMLFFSSPNHGKLDIHFLSKYTLPSSFPQGAFIGYDVFFQTEVLFLNSLEILRSQD